MTIHLMNVILIFIAYGVGSLSSAIIVCRLWGLPDPRTLGSKNPGATNVLRLGGKIPALVTLLGDSLKAFIPILLAKYLGASPFLQAILVLMTCLGHIFPIFFGFKGGKGVATGLGGVLALSWPLGMAVIGLWLIMAAIFRYSSLAAITAFSLLPCFVYVFSNKQYFFPLLCLAIIVVFKHHANIKKLYLGQEKKIGQKVA
jgi:acyl phosphate:glycerol-3-phosphate acyltransferase